MSNDNKIKSYRGTGRYVFACYSHQDADTVYPDLLTLRDLGVNVWFDEGIKAGEDWTELLATAISNCTHFVYFITPSSVASEYCRRELTYANQRAIPVTVVLVEPTQLPGGIELAIGNRQIIKKYELSHEDYAEKLSQSLRIGEKPSPDKPAPKIKPAEKKVEPDHAGILILPFINLSSDEKLKHICTGISEEVISALSSVQTLKIISGSTARQIDQDDLDLGTVGKQLNVEYLLEGSVQKSGNKLRITTNLLKTQSNEILWAHKWDCSIEQIFDIQETIAQGVVGALEIQLNSNQLKKLTSRPIPDIHAYEYFLRAKQLVYSYTPEALLKALDYLKQGEAIMGKNSYITAATGHVHWQIANLEGSPVHLKEVEKCIDTLFSLDSRSADAHRLAGLLKIKEKDAIQSAVNHLKVSLETDPNDTTSLFWLSALYAFVGRTSSGLALAERLLSIDPLTTLHQVLPGLMNVMDGHFAQACPKLLESHQLNHGNPMTTIIYGQALAMNKQNEESEEIFDSMIALFAGSSFAMLGSFYKYSMQGDKEAALAAATEQLKAEAKPDLQFSWYMAQCYALINEQEQSIDWLENAIQFGFWNYPLLAEKDPLLESLRQNTRYQSLMSRLKEKWIYFED